MDQTTKQRLVGAIVLVVAVLWIVPIFLYGPSQEAETISETVTLPGVEIKPNQLQTIELEPRTGTVEVEDAPAVVNRAEPAVAPSEAKDEEQSAVQPKAQTPRPKPEPKPAVEKPVEKAVEEKPVRTAAQTQQKLQSQPQSPPPAASEPSGDLWAVQLGSFSGRENAEKLAAGLRGKGIAAFISDHKKGDATMHRVRIGPINGRASADEQARKLAASGHTGQVVPHP